MKRFECDNCGNKVYFGNVTCVKCHSALGFDDQALVMRALALDEATAGLYRGVKNSGGKSYRYCANAAHDACNWLIPDGGPATYCKACELNGTVPDLSSPENVQAWQDLERAKKRLIYSIFRFGLPVDATAAGKGRLTFDFVQHAVTGHLDGVITIDILEADAVERERQRQQFDEPYRSLLGHLRHESGHFYWNVLVEGGDRLEAFRAMFGDERKDYVQALSQHHANGAPGDWQVRHVSAYASAHPWEDWAETWAHYIHMVDAVETAENGGIEPRSSGLKFGSIWPFKRYDIYREGTYDSLRDRWVPLTIALNMLNRGMGHSDFYPFVISATAHKKLEFVHDLVRANLIATIGKPKAK